MTGKRRPIVLCIVDGFGIRDEAEGNAFAQSETPTLDALWRDHPVSRLRASGQAVGLAEGAVGHGEVGHMTLGAGRLVQTARTRFDATVEKRKLSFVPMLDQTVRICMYDECPIHLIGLVGDGDVHADMAHLYQLIDTFSFNEVPIVIHAILDGRDTRPMSALTHLDRLQGYIEDRKAKIGTVVGSHFAMDRNERWDRTYQAFHAMVRDRQLGPTALQADTPYDAVSQAHMKDLGDAFVEPTRIGDYQGMNGDYLCDFSSSADKQVWEWSGLDAGLVFNHRADGIRQLVAMLSRQDVPPYVTDDLLMDRHFPVRAFREHCLAVTAPAGGDVNLPTLFPADPLQDTLGEVLATAGLRQLRCAETEKRTHVTTYFSGGHEVPFEGESRKVVKSPRLVDTYDDKPKMAAQKVATAVVTALEQGDADVVIANIANADMVTTMAAAKEALAAVDEAVARMREAVQKVGGVLIVTSDHGNCEELVSKAGKRLRAHTPRDVPLIVAGAQPALALQPQGTLADVAPTLLDILGIDKPDAMTGSSLRLDSPGEGETTD